MRRTTMAVTVAATALCLGTAACDGDGAPPGNVSVASVSAGAALRQLSAKQATAKPAPPVVGVNLYVNENYPLAQTKAWGARDLRYIADTLKLKAVAFAFDYNVPSPSSDIVTASPSRTPTMADLAALTSIARSYGLQVEYRALFAIGNTDSRSGSIQPENLGEWLSSLFTAQTPALKLAQRYHISEFVAGTEMASIDQSPLWGGFFARAATIYHGILSYASWGGKNANGGFFSPRRLLLPLHYFGASAYPPVKLPSTASIARLTKAWVAFLLQAPEPVLQRTAIDEIGIPAVTGAYAAPYQWDGIGHPKPDLAVQSNWYRAACQAADLVHVRAIYFWNAVLSADPASGKPSLEGFEGHQATEAAIRSCP
jgi:hypothetical protein